MDTDDTSSWIRRTRKDLGLTQAVLSAEAGVSLATLQNLEAGTANPSLATLRRLFNVLGLGLTVRPESADWDVLAALGLPLSTLDGRSRPNIEIRDLPMQVKRAALELSDEEPGASRQRKLESLQALLLALRQHFPGIYRLWFGRVPIVRKLVPQEPTGRVIKLSRVARARLVDHL